MRTVSADLLTGEIDSRVDALRAKYADNPFVARIEHKIDFDWTGDEAVFIKVILSPNLVDREVLKQLGESLHWDMVRVVHMDDLGLHAYLNFVSQN